jgi:pilus assembly protein FimV
LIYHQRLLRSSVAPVAAIFMTLAASNAHALSMGKLRVQSALGQSLVAEIDLADLSDDDAGSLKSELASPSTFAGMGLEYNYSLNGTLISLQRRPNGSRYLKITGNRALNDPFVDILVELSWASGKIVRTYTVLLDPQKSQDAAPAPLLPAPVADSPSAAPKAASAAASATALTASPTTVATQGSATGANKKAFNAPIALAGVASGSQRVKVNTGDTAGKIASAWATDGATVEQMLVAMLNANPAAFAGGNVNRLLANTEILVPESATVQKISPSDAQRLIHRQNRDFQNLRRTLAGQAPTVATPSNPTESKGNVAQAAPVAGPKMPPGDTLKLSKGSSQDIAEKASMEQIAQQRAKTEANERARELAKNIEELNQLAKVATKPETLPSPVAPATAASNLPQGSGISSAPSAASASSQAVTPAVIAAVAPPTKAPAGWFDGVVRNPDLGALMLALLGLLGGWAWYRRAQAKKNDGNAMDAGSKWNSSASTSFALAGAHNVDTSEVSASTQHTSVYQESQLEMANELDPVAEAEVYLAYGKDVPAEEILKEGLQQTPQRIAIHLKLLAIYAKRGDVKSFESMARDVKGLTQGSGADWNQVLDMGLSLEPTNPLYNSTLARGAEAATQLHPFQATTLNIKPDDLEALAGTREVPNTHSPLAEHRETTNVPDASPHLLIEAASPQSSGSFDLGSISLAVTQQVPESNLATTERLEATLALAEQFIEIGENEGALALIDEVMAGGNEALRSRATELRTKAR